MKTLKWMAAMAAVTVMCMGFSSCRGKEEKEGEKDNLIGYWVSESHLNNPERNGSGGAVLSNGFQFYDNGTVCIFSVQHTGLSSRYSSYEANTSWEKIAERNGVVFYINPQKKMANYSRSGNQITILSSGEIIMMSIIGSSRANMSSSDGWTEGSYIRVRN